MSDIKISVQNDNDKDVQKDHIPEQTSLDTTIDMHADEVEEKDVRRSVLLQEEHETRRGQSEAKMKENAIQIFGIFDKEVIVGYNQPPPGYQQPGQGWYQGPPPPPQPQQQGWYQGPPPPPPPPPQQQGWFQGPPPPQEQQGWFHPRHSNYASGPPLVYTPEKPDRNVFVRKVMMILFAMLMVTCIFMMIVLMVPMLKSFFRRFALFIMIPCLIILMGMSCIMPTSPCARKSPTNYLCLVIVVILESLVTAAITAKYKTDIVLQAFLATMICVALCVILAFTKFDFTKCLLFVIIVMMALSMVLLIVIIARFAFGVYSKPLMIAILVAFTVLNVIMITIELQMVLGGKSIELSEVDYALGAYLLYTSILELFTTLVQLMGHIS